MKNKGFTLIELSIVLVIIGLIIGGILVGRDLIHTAEIRRTVSQIQAVDTAVSTFKLKYNCIPGDCLNATTYFGAGVVNGNGNGRMDDDGANDPETINFWNHLAQAGLVSGGFAAYATQAPFDTAALTGPGPYLSGAARGDLNLSPTTGLKRYINVTRPPNTTYTPSLAVANNYYYLSVITYNFGLSVGLLSITDLCKTGLSNTNCLFLQPVDAFAIDTKIDDGNPNTGTAGAFDQTDHEGCGAAAIYDVNITLISCMLLIKPSSF